MNRIILLLLITLMAFGSGRFLSSGLELAIQPSAEKLSDGENSAETAGNQQQEEQRTTDQQVQRQVEQQSTIQQQKSGQQQGQQQIQQTTNQQQGQEQQQTTAVTSVKNTTAETTNTAIAEETTETITTAETTTESQTTTQASAVTPIGEAGNISIDSVSCYTQGPWPLPPPSQQGSGEGGPVFMGGPGYVAPPPPQTVFKVQLYASASGPIGIFLDPHNAYPSAFRLYHSTDWSNTIIYGNQGGEYDRYVFFQRDPGQPYTAKLTYIGEARINNSDLSPAHFPYLTDSAYNMEVGYKDPASPNSHATLLESNKVQKSGVIQLNSCSSEKSNNLPDGTASVSGPVYICSCETK